MAGTSARDGLLALVVQNFLDGGRTDNSLRTIASEVGTSHRMLIYHFGSFDGLIQAVVDEVEVRQRDALSAIATGGGDLASIARRFWRTNSSPELAPLARLFFQLYAGLLERGENERAAALVTAWLDPVTAMLVGRGVPRAAARAHARLGLAVTRGLLLDLLATGDRRSVNAAMNAYIARVVDPG